MDRSLRRRNIIGLLGLTSLSGCLRLTSNGESTTAGLDATSERTGTTAGTTESPESTASETTTDVEMPIGMNESGISPLLADGYLSAMQSLSGFKLESGVERLGRSPYEGRTSCRVEDDTATISKDTTGFEVDKYIAVNGRKRNTWRSFLEGAPVYGDVVKPGTSLPLNNILHVDLVAWVAAAGDFGSPDVSRDDDTTRFVVSTDTVADPEPALEFYHYIDADRVESLSAKLIVRQDGIVEEFESELKIAAGEDLIVFREQLRTSEYDTATVEQPAWFEKARDRAPDIEMRREGDHVVIRHTGGDPIPESSEVTLSSNAGGYGGSIELSSDFEPDQELWLWRDGQTSRLSRGEPSESSPDLLDAEDVVRIRLNSPVYAKTLVGEMS